MDTLIEKEWEIIASIAKSNDHPLLMINLNRYIPGNFPQGELYYEWRKINTEMIHNVGGKILWSLEVKGQLLTNGPMQPLDEILAYWYPSHKDFIQMRNFDAARKNFEIRKQLIEYAVVHRCNGENPPILNK